MSKTSLALAAALSLAAVPVLAATARGPAQQAAPAPYQRPTAAAAQTGAPGDFSCDFSSEIRTRLEHRACDN